MKLTINLINKKEKQYAQYFHFFTEESWEKAKSGFSDNFGRFFTGKKNEVFFEVYSDSMHYYIGVGKDGFQDFELQSVAQKFAFNNRKNIQAVSTKIEGDFDASQYESLIKGLYLGTYEYPFADAHIFWQKGFELHIESLNPQKLKTIKEKTLALCEGQFSAMDWLNKPANFKSADLISQYLKNLAKEKKLKYTAFNRKKCEELGLGAYLAVNKGSSKDAAFTILEYQSSDKKAKTIGLVGKCVLFDTGGISIKGSQNMHYMKSDMGGATAVIGILIAAAEMELPVNIIAILPITDNAVSRDAYLPSDVIKAYNGKTIEVLDTDAEGRMTLADGLSYLSKNYKTDALIDLATLTGSSVRMFGDTCGALFSNNDLLKNELISSGDKTNQRLWNLPLWDIWKDDIQSDVADFKNISMKPIGDCIVAAKFLEQFIDGHQNWAHLDIAGVAFGNVIYAKEKAATGYGVQLLLDFIEDF